MRSRAVAAALAAALLTSGCAALQPKPKPAPPVRITADPYPSTYQPYPGVPTLIRGATIFDGDGGRIEKGDVLIADGVIKAVEPKGRIVVGVQTGSSSKECTETFDQTGKKLGAGQAPNLDVQ